MPASRYYLVTQERELRVRASSPLDAATIASGKLDGHGVGDVQGQVVSEVKVTDLSIREEVL